MHDEHPFLSARSADLSYDEIQLLVREGRRQRAQAVRVAINWAIASTKIAFYGVMKKIHSAGDWLSGRTA